MAVNRERYPHLFAPLSVGELTFHNRVLAAPLAEDMDRTVPELVDRYEVRARGGFGGVAIPAGLSGRVAQAVRDHGAVPLTEGGPALVWAEGLEAAEAAKAGGAAAVAAVCDLTDPAEMEAALAAGRCDLIALKGQQMADPGFVNKLLSDREVEIAPCLGCAVCGPLHTENGCSGRCPANPRCGDERRWHAAPRPTGKRRVMVVGGGPGGLSAAATAAERGHDVILVEACRSLGGLLWFTDVNREKGALRRLRDSLIARCRRLGVKFQLGTTVTADYVARMAPDAVICAVGSSPLKPDIPGIELTRNVLFCFDKPDQVGRRVVMLGGGLVGCECGLWLAGAGRQVHILESREALAPEANEALRGLLLDQLRDAVAWDCSVQVLKITERGARYLDRDGVERFTEADTVLCAAGQTPNRQTVEELRAVSRQFAAVGDCVQVREVGDAIREGFTAAMDIL